jgi:hypothetical protein
MAHCAHAYVGVQIGKLKDRETVKRWRKVGETQPVSSDNDMVGVSPRAGI